MAVTLQVAERNNRRHAGGSRQKGRADYPARTLQRSSVSRTSSRKCGILRVRQRRGSDDFLQRLYPELVEAFPLFRGVDIGAAVEFQRQPHYELAGEWLVGPLVALGAELKIVVNRLSKGLSQLVHDISLESNYVRCIQDFTVEQSDLADELDTPGVSLILQHL
jgi:hypothetical protein